MAANNNAQVRLSFRDVRYRRLHWSLQHPVPRPKEILHGVSGEFLPGQLSAIMGPSGAGKSTLLDVLAAFKRRGSSGEVLANGRPAAEAVRRGLCAYIQQEDHVRGGVTPLEAMTLATRLKTGAGVAEARSRAEEVLRVLGLLRQQDTLTARLSGGQRRRLSVALELAGDPAVLFLDEPTTGLDSVSTTRCVELLRLLAREGRTVVCTLHQPSARLFALVDRVYALAQGRCVYDGAPDQLLPHLAARGLQCPPYHNPADFLIEVSVGDYGADVQELASYVDKRPAPAADDKEEFPEWDSGETCISTRASLWLQFYLLYRRNLLCMWRHYTPALNRVVAHVSIGFLFGYLYFDCGVGAHTTLANFVYIYGSTLFLLYTGKMAVTLQFPLEWKILQREHFNHWYSIVPYFLSLLSVDIPLQVISGWLYLVISYQLTGQPTDFDRVVTFFSLLTIASLVAQGCGYVIGVTTPVKIAVFVGPVLLALLSMFGFNIFHKFTPASLEFLFHVSYFRMAFQGAVTAVYGFDRGDLLCPEDHLYCHYRYPSKFLTDVDVVGVDVSTNMILLGVYCVVAYAVALLAIWIKLVRR